VATKTSDGSSTSIGWRTTVFATAQPFANVSALNGTMTIICPYAATFTTPTVTVASGTGACSAVTCPQQTLAAKTGVDCTFTCDPTVLSVSANVRVQPTGDVLFNFTGVVNATRTTLADNATKCVWVTDPLFVVLNPASWQNVSVCFASATAASPRVINFNSAVPAPLDTQCALGVANYTVTNIAYAVTGDGSNVTLNSSSAVANVPCPSVSFTIAGSMTRTVTYNWCAEGGA
jgi:hypothetical protein